MQGVFLVLRQIYGSDDEISLAPREEVGIGLNPWCTQDLEFGQLSLSLFFSSGPDFKLGSESRIEKED